MKFTGSVALSTRIPKIIFSQGGPSLGGGIVEKSKEPITGTCTVMQIGDWPFQWTILAFTSSSIKIHQRAKNVKILIHSCALRKKPVTQLLKVKAFHVLLSYRKVGVVAGAFWAALQKTRLGLLDYFEILRFDSLNYWYQTIKNTKFQVISCSWRYDVIKFVNSPGTIHCFRIFTPENRYNYDKNTCLWTKIPVYGQKYLFMVKNTCLWSKMVFVTQNYTPSPST